MSMFLYVTLVYVGKTKDGSPLNVLQILQTIHPPKVDNFWVMLLTYGTRLRTLVSGLNVENSSNQINDCAWSYKTLQLPLQAYESWVIDLCY
jgi:hypothetical protein